MTKNIFIFLTIFSVLPSFSQEKPQPSEKADKKYSAREVLSKLKEWDDKLITFKTKFKQKAVFKNADVTKEISGEITYKKPSMLKIEHFAPKKQIIITDKKKIFIVKPSEDETYEADWNEWKKHLDGSLASLIDFGDYSSLLEKNSAEISYSDDKIILKMKNKKNPSAYILTLFLSKEDFFPQSARLEVEDSSIETEFISIIKNKDISEEEFKKPKTKKTEKIK